MRKLGKRMFINEKWISALEDWMEEMSLNKEIKHQEVDTKGRAIWRSDPIHLTGEY